MVILDICKKLGITDFTEKPLYIANNINQINTQVRRNLRSISLTSIGERKIDPLDFDNYFEKLVNIYSNSLKDQNVSEKLIFYMWHDEMAGTLYWNVISDFGQNLPFTCKIIFVKSIYEIIISFLQSTYNNCIPISEFKELPVQEINDHNGDDEEFVQYVYKTYL